MKTVLALILATSIVSTGCAFLGGAAVGALGAGAGYEYQAHRQMERLEEDYKAGRITREEYLDRKRQIEKGSILY
jgi:hypothetical protein